MASNPEDGTEFSLQEYLAVLRVRKWSIAGITAAALIVAVVISMQLTPQYSSTARVLVKPLTTNPASTTVQQPITNLVDLDTEKEIVQSSAVAKLANEELKSTASLGSLSRHLSVGVPTDTQILSITYTDPDPNAARRGAQAFADGYLKFRTKQAISAFTRVNTGIQDELNNLQKQLRDAQAKAAASPPGSPKASAAQADVSELTSQIAILRNEMGTLSAVDVDPGEIIQDAVTPSSPSSPNIPLNAGLALVLGLGAGVGVAFLRDRLDVRLRGRADLEERTGAPVLAVIPKVETWRERGEPKLVTLSEPKSAAAEAYRTLRTSVMFTASQEGLKALMVTSPGPGEGKTTTAANLAVVLAQADKRVILVSADLRKPRIHRFFGLSNKRGLVNVLAGETEAADALQAPDVERLRLLGAGPSSGRPAEWLQSEQMGRLLGMLRDHADFVIIDAAPVLVVADPLALAPMVDGVLFVADADDTSRHGVERAREHLAQVGAKVIGAVLNDFDPGKARVYEPYAYRRYSYGRRYRYAEDGYGAGYETGNGRAEDRTRASATPPPPPAPTG